MPATFMPLVGGENIIQVRDADSTLMLPAQISGVTAEGRAGSLKTSFLVALSGASEFSGITTSFQNLGDFTLYGPYSHPVPANPGAVNFDYSSIIPVCRGAVIADGFVPTGDEWPTSLTAYLAATGALLNMPSQVSQIQVIPLSVNPVAASSQYGSYTFALRGGIVDTEGSLLTPLILVEVDFSHSIAN